MSKAHRKSIVREVIERFDTKMATHESRRNAKIALREQNGRAWSISTGRIHSYKTRSVYQEQTIRFAKWARAEHQILSLEQLDPRADELATTYLQQQLAEQKSPYTLQTERSALRLFFDNRTLASTVQIPRRARANITRSRGKKDHDRHFQPEHWPELVKFTQACGLRRHELRKLCCRDIYDRNGQLLVYVKKRGAPGTSTARGTFKMCHPSYESVSTRTLLCYGCRSLLGISLRAAMRLKIGSGTCTGCTLAKSITGSGACNWCRCASTNTNWSRVGIPGHAAPNAMSRPRCCRIAHCLTWLRCGATAGAMCRERSCGVSRGSRANGTTRSITNEIRQGSRHLLPLLACFSRFFLQYPIFTGCTT